MSDNQRDYPQFTYKQTISKDIWDAKANKAKGKEAVAVNFALENIKDQIAKHYQRISDREAFVTAEMVRNMPIRVSVRNTRHC